MATSRIEKLLEAFSGPSLTGSVSITGSSYVDLQQLVGSFAKDVYFGPHPASVPYEGAIRSRFYELTGFPHAVTVHNARLRYINEVKGQINQYLGTLPAHIHILLSGAFQAYMLATKLSTFWAVKTSDWTTAMAKPAGGELVRTVDISPLETAITAGVKANLKAWYIGYVEGNSLIPKDIQQDLARRIENITGFRMTTEEIDLILGQRDRAVDKPVPEVTVHLPTLSTGPIATGEALTASAIRSYAPLFHGARMGVEPGIDEQPGVPSEVQKQVHPLFWKQAERALGKSGTSWQNLSPEQQTNLLALLGDIQAMYDTHALLALAQEDILLRPRAAHLGAVPLGYRFLSPLFPEEPSKRLSYLSQGPLYYLVEESVKSVVTNTFTPTITRPGPGNLASWQAYALSSLSEKTPSIHAALSHYKQIRPADVPVYTDIVLIYVTEGINRFIADQAASGRVYKSASDFATLIDQQLDVLIKGAVERCAWSEWSMTLYAEYVDKALSVVMPYHPSFTTFRPARTSAQDNVIKFWQDEIRPQLRDDLIRQLESSGRSVLNLPSPVTILASILRRIEPLLPETTNPWKWHEFLASTSDFARRSTIEAYVDDCLAKLDRIVADIVPVLSTAKVLWWKGGILHFTSFAKDIADRVGEFGFLAITGTSEAPALPRSNVDSMITDMVVVPFLDRGQTTWRGTVPSSVLVHLTDKVIDWVRTQPEAYKLYMALQDPTTPVLSVPQIAIKLQQFLSANQVELDRVLGVAWSEISHAPAQPLHAVFPAPWEFSPEYVSYMTAWTTYTYGALAGYDPSTVWSITPEQAVEEGWAALKDWLVSTLKQRFPGVPGPEIEFFVDSARDLVDKMIQQTVWQVRLGRDRFWDPDNQLHISSAEDVKKQMGVKVFRKPTTSTSESWVVARFALLEIYNTIHGLAQAEFGIITPGEAESPGFVSRAELEQAVRYNAELVKATIPSMLDVSWPLQLRWAQAELARAAVDEILPTVIGRLTELLPAASTADGFVTLLDRIDNTRDIFERVAKTAVGSLAKQPEADPLSPYKTLAIPDEDWLEFAANVNPLLPPQFRGMPMSSADTARAGHQIFASWSDALNKATVAGNPAVSYSIVLDSVDWRTLYNPGPKEEQFVKIFEEAKHKFLSQGDHRLIPLVQSVLWQIPIFGEKDIEAVRYSIYRLLTREWENFLMSEFERHGFGQPQVKFQRPREPRIDLSNPEVNRTYFEAIRRELGLAGGIINQIWTEVNTLRGALVASQVAGLLLDELYSLWREQTKGLPPMTDGELASWMVGFTRTFERKANTIRKNVISKAYEDTADLEFWAANILNEEYPIAQRLGWLASAELMPGHPVAQRILRAEPYLLQAVGLVKSPAYIVSQLKGFEERFRRAQQGLFPSRYLATGPVSDLSYDYLHRLYAECIYPIEATGMRHLIPPEALAWFDLAKLMWERKIVFPTSIEQYQEVHEGFRWAAEHAITNPDLVPLIRFWKQVQPVLMDYASRQGGLETISAIFSVAQTTRLTNKALDTHWYDAMGYTYTYERAQAIANPALMRKLLEEGDIRLFDVLWERYWVPFMYQENQRDFVPWWTGWFEYEGGKLRQLRKDYEGRSKQ